MTGIIVLNWNGWKDTIACLKSLYSLQETNFFVIVVDNGSSDNSIEEIDNFLKVNRKAEFYKVNEVSGNLDITGADYGKITNKTTFLYCLKQNYGFAKGNNIGIEFAKLLHPEFILLLNNDTEVEPDFLSKLISFSKSYPKYVALCPKICFFYDKNLIWNCGGKIWWGFRKYYYARSKEDSIKEKEYLEISFVTGCALFFRTSMVENSKLLTERFFHGEEDFELSYRYKKLGYKMACVLGSKIYHKVGSSTKSLNSIGKIYAHYLNRFINMRLHMNKVSYICWKGVSFIHIYRLLKHRNISNEEIIKFIKKLNIESKQLNEVTQQKFLDVLRNGI